MVWLPCGSLPMGTSPVCHQGNTMPTPALLAGGLRIGGGDSKLHSRFAGAPGDHDCLKTGQCADFQWGGYPAGTYVCVLVVGSTKAPLPVRGRCELGRLTVRRYRGPAKLAVPRFAPCVLQTLFPLPF